MTRWMATVVVVLAGATGCGDDTSGGGGAGGSGSTGEGGATTSTGDGGATSTSTGATTSTGDTSSTGDATTSTASGGSAYDQACAALCATQNAAREAAGCEPDDCEDACRFLDKPGCESEGAAVAACQAEGNVVCSCDGGVTQCQNDAFCLEEQDAYDACEGECSQLGTGTPDEARASFLAWCEEAVRIGEEAGCTEATDCEGLADLIVQASEGCEAETTNAYDCLTPVMQAIDGADCTCANNQLSCPDLDQDACAAEAAAAEACSACE